MTPHEQAISALKSEIKALKEDRRYTGFKKPVDDRIDGLQKALTALRSEPSGSVSDGNLLSNENIETIAEFVAGDKSNLGSHADRWDAAHSALLVYRDHISASRSTPAVPSVEEIMAAFKATMDHRYTIQDENEFRARLTQAQLSGNSGGLGRSGTNVPSGSPAVGSPPPHEQAHGQATAPSIPNATHPQNPDAQ